MQKYAYRFGLTGIIPDDTIAIMGELAGLHIDLAYGICWLFGALNREAAIDHAYMNMWECATQFYGDLDEDVPESDIALLEEFHYGLFNDGSYYGHTLRSLLETLYDAIVTLGIPLHCDVEDYQFIDYEDIEIVLS